MRQMNSMLARALPHKLKKKTLNAITQKCEHEKVNYKTIVHNKYIYIPNITYIKYFMLKIFKKNKYLQHT